MRQMIEPFRQRVVWTQFSHMVIHLQLSWTMTYMLILSVGIAFTVTSVVSLARFVAQAPPNPFAAFANMLPGQPGSVVERPGFSCVDIPYPTSTKVCTLWFETGIFSRVEVSVNAGVIHSTIFRVRERVIRLGDLMELWGKPMTELYQSSFHVSWMQGNITVLTSADTRHYRPFTPIKYIHFENNP